MDYKTVSSESFKRMEPVSNQLNSDIAKRLRNHNIVLGVSEPKFETTYSILGKAKANSETPVKSLTSDRSKVSLVLGSDKPSYKSVTKSDYSGTARSPVSLNPGLLKDLRSSHFKLGGDKKNFSTVYSGNYGWVDPVPLKGVKFSTE
jgi:hypothetical protein